MIDSNLTPYQAAKQINVVLTEAGLKTIPPQMMYNYVKNRLIASVVTDDGVRIRQSELNRFAEKYVEKRLTKANS